MWPVINETGKQIDKKEQIAKVKGVFFIFENICFRSHESRQQSTQIRIKAHLVLQKTYQTCHYPGIFVLLKRKI